MARYIGVLMLLAVGFSQAEAQRLVDHWSTAAECMAAKEAPFYYPTILRQQPLGKDEVVRGHPTGGCFEMDLPDRLGKRGFVKIEAGRPFVYDQTTGKVLRLAQCNNTVHEWTPFPPVRDGRDGRDGVSAPASQSKMDISAIVAQMFASSTPPTPVKKSWCGTKCRWTLAGIGGVAIGFGVRELLRKDPRGPEVKTLPPGPGM